MSEQSHYCEYCQAPPHCFCLVPVKTVAIGAAEAQALAELERINRTREAKRRATREQDAT